MKKVHLIKFDQKNHKFSERNLEEIVDSYNENENTFVACEGVTIETFEFEDDDIVVVSTDSSATLLTEDAYDVKDVIE